MHKVSSHVFSVNDLMTWKLLEYVKYFAVAVQSTCSLLRSIKNATLKSDYYCEVKQIQYKSVDIVMLTEERLDSGQVYCNTFDESKILLCIWAFSDIVNPNLNAVSCNLMKRFLKVLVNTILGMTFRNYSEIFPGEHNFPSISCVPFYGTREWHPRCIS